MAARNGCIDDDVGVELMKVKICGITREREIEYLNEAMPEYAGFVIFEKSKRYVTAEKAALLMKSLRREILRVAVTVEPSEELIREIEEAGFDLIQIHGAFSDERIRAVRLPVFRAYNSDNLNEIAITETDEKIRGYVLDAASYGSGVTSDWALSFDREKLWQKLGRREFILAGGLNPENVAEGIRIFSPDTVDVSSGVEGPEGKDREKILRFMEEARKRK